LYSIICTTKRGPRYPRVHLFAAAEAEAAPAASVHTVPATVAVVVLVAMTLARHHARAGV